MKEASACGALLSARGFIYYLLPKPGNSWEGLKEPGDCLSFSKSVKEKDPVWLMIKVEKTVGMGLCVVRDQLQALG